MTNDDTRYVRISGITSLVAHGASENQTSTANYLTIASNYIINNLIQMFGLNSVECKRTQAMLTSWEKLNICAVLLNDADSNNKYMTASFVVNRPASWSSGQGLCLLIIRSRVRFPVLPWEIFLAGKDSHGDHGLGN